MFYVTAAWLVLAFAFAIVELVTPALFFGLSITGGALAAATSSYYGCDSFIQIFLFLTGIFVFFLPLAWYSRRVVRRHGLRTNADALPGQVGEVITLCDCQHAGLVVVGGQEWTAFALHKELLPGTAIRVVRVQGVRLIVEALIQ